MKYFSVLVALLVSMTATAQNVQAPRLHVLENGLRVITVEDHSSPLVSTVWSAHVGDSAEPPDFAGNSHYLEHLLLFRGTEKYPGNEIGEWSASRGGYFNGYTWNDYTAFVLMASTADLDGVLDRHEQMMFHGAFSGEDFETEKKAVFEELRSGLDTPYGYLWRASAYHMYPEETFYSRSTIGTIETVQAATVERVSEYYKGYYIPNNMTFAIVGDIDTDDLLNKLEQRLGKYPSAPVPPSIYEPVSMKAGINLVTEERDLGKAYFLVATESPRAGSPDYFPYVLLAEYLAGGKTSLLQTELILEQELLDDIYMSSRPRRFARGWQGISAETSPEKVSESVDALWKLLAGVRRNGVPAGDMQFARQRLLKNHRQLLDDQYQIAENLAIADAHGDYGLFAEYEQRLGAVSASDVQAVARKYLTPDHFFLMTLFPPGEIPEGFEASIRTNAANVSGGQGSVAIEELQSGVTLLHELKQSAAMESYTVAVRAGDRHGDDAGLAEAVATMMTRETGSYSRTELQNLLDKNGFTLDSYTSSDAAFIELQAPSGSSDAAMALLVDVLGHPAFSTGEWENVQQEMISELKRSQDQPQAVASDLLTKTMFAGTPYGRSVSERLEVLPTTKAKDLGSFWSKYYKPSSIAISYHGAASPEQVKSGLAPLGKLSGRVPALEPIEIKTIESEIHAPFAMQGKTQVNLYIAWHAPEITGDDWMAWELAAKAIGGDLAGRLWKLRQGEGLAYSVWMGSNMKAEQSIAYVYMATASEKREAALAAIHREIGAVQAGLTEEELDRVKVSYLANLNRLDRTAARRSRRHAVWWVYGLAPDYREQLTGLVKGATLDDVNRVIREVLDPENFVFVEAGAVDG
jgi:zinc protease